MRRVHKNLCPAMIIASIMAVNMWKNSLKNLESDNNKILYKNLLNVFLQRNGTYCLNKPRIMKNQSLIAWFALKIGAVGYFELSVLFYQTTRNHVPKV